MNSQVLDASMREQVLVDLSLWLSRVLQYSAAHPACAKLGDKTHATVARALAVTSPLAFGVLKDDIMVDGAPAKHPVLRTRVAPHLHARGVLLIRFVQGVTVEELSQLVDLLALPEQTIFDRGGLSRLAVERKIARVQIEEIAHDISAEERTAQQRRTKFREFFTEMLRTALSRRRPDAALADQIIELLDHPEIAVTVLEEDAAGIAEAAAGLALILEQQQQRTGEDARAKLVPVLLALAPSSRVRLLLGFPPLAGDFRRAFAKVVDLMTEAQLARLVLPSVRAHAENLEPVLYALSAAVPHDGTRYSALRRVALSFFDLAGDDMLQGVLSALAQPIPEYDSFRRERECLRDHAVVALLRRGDADARTTTISPEPPVAFDGGRTVADLIEIVTRTRSFDRFCQRLVTVAPAMGRDGAFGALRGLASAAASHPSNDVRAVAAQSHREVSTAVAPEVLADLDGAAEEADEAKLASIASTVALFASHAPVAVLDRLDISESRAFRRILLDALASSSSAELVSLLRPRLHSSKWYVTRNAVILLGRAGGTGADLVPIANHPREQVRREIVRVLRSMLDPAAMDIVALYLTDASPEIAAHAPSLLRGELLGPSAIARLETFACDEQRREDLRRRVVLALGRSPRDEAAAALLRILQPKGFVDLGSGAIRDLAASALRHSPAPGAQGYFEQGLRSSSFRVRKACERVAEQK
ncbi:MAG: HEAT repeat domain-containing protein [Polyangiales bacterium]